MLAGGLAGELLHELTERLLVPAELLQMFFEFELAGEFGRHHRCLAPSGDPDLPALNGLEGEVVAVAAFEKMRAGSPFQRSARSDQSTDQKH